MIVIIVIVHLYPKLSVYNSNMKIQLHKESVVVLHPLGEYQNCECEHHPQLRSSSIHRSTQRQYTGAYTGFLRVGANPFFFF